MPHAWCEVLCRSRAIVGVAPQSVSSLCGALRRSVTAPLFAPHNVVRSLFACTWMSILRIELSPSRACAASRAAPRLRPVCTVALGRSRSKEPRSPSRPRARRCAFAVRRSIGSDLARLELMRRLAPRCDCAQCAPSRLGGRAQRSRAPRLGRVPVDVPSRSADLSDRT